MVYKRYIKKGGKTFGPYYYKSYRDSKGNVKTEYVEDHESPSRKLLTISICLLVLIAGILITFGMGNDFKSSKEVFSGNVILDYNLIRTPLQESFTSFGKWLVFTGFAVVDDSLVYIENCTEFPVECEEYDSNGDGVVTMDEYEAGNILDESPCGDGVREDNEECDGEDWCFEDCTLDLDYVVVNGCGEPGWCDGYDLDQDGVATLGEARIASQQEETEESPEVAALLAPVREYFGMTGCSEENDWCYGGDRNQDGSVNGGDLSLASSEIEAFEQDGVKIWVLKEDSEGFVSEEEFVDPLLEQEILLGEGELGIETTRTSVRLGEPVVTQTVVTFDEETKDQIQDIELEIPLEATDIKVSTDEELIDENTNLITTNAIKENMGKGIFYRLWEWFRGLFRITGNVIQEEEIEESIRETAENKIIEVKEVIDKIESETGENVTRIAIQYTTPSPTAEETKTENGKKVVISANDDLGYENIEAFTELDNSISIDAKEKVRLYWTNELGEGKRVNFEAEDRDGDGFIDWAEWTVPHLSSQKYEFIYITKADHLDKNRNFIEDIYGRVKEEDSVWTKPILPGEYVRVAFEKNLTNQNDITIYARTDNLGEFADIEVYLEGGQDIVALFENISFDDWHQVLLTLLPEGESYDVFDLKIVGAAVEFDYIVDPVSVYGDFVDNGSLQQILYGCGVLNTPGATYTLNQSLDADVPFSSNPCLNITVDGVLVDLNGFSIVSIQPSVTGGLFVISSDNNEIKNGIVSTQDNITFFGGLIEGNNNIVDNLTFFRTYTVNGAVEVAGQNNTIKNSNFTSNIIGIGINYGSESNQILDNTFNSNNVAINCNGNNNAFSENNIWNCSTTTGACIVVVGDNNNFTGGSVDLSGKDLVKFAGGAAGASGNLFSNMTFLNSGATGMDARGDNNVAAVGEPNIFINVSMDNSKVVNVGSITLSRGWYHQVYVEDSNGFALEGATIREGQEEGRNGVSFGGVLGETDEAGYAIVNLIEREWENEGYSYAVGYPTIIAVNTSLEINAYSSDFSEAEDKNSVKGLITLRDDLPQDSLFLNHNDMGSTAYAAYYDNIVQEGRTYVLVENVSKTVRERFPADTCFYTNAGLEMFGCVNIQANNVILDLNGFTIDGTEGYDTCAEEHPYYFDYSGIYVGNYENVTIRNGGVEDYHIGIHLDNDGNTTVDNVTLIKNAYGAYLNYSSGTIIDNVEASHGKCSYRRGVYAYYGNQTTILNSYFENNSKGLAMAHSAVGLVVNNSIFNSHVNQAVDLEGTSTEDESVRISNISVWNVTSYSSIYLVSIDDSIISGGSLSNLDVAGMTLISSSNNVFENLNISDSVSNPIILIRGGGSPSINNSFINVTYDVDESVEASPDSEFIKKWWFFGESNLAETLFEVFNSSGDLLFSDVTSSPTASFGLEEYTNLGGTKTYADNYTVNITHPINGTIQTQILNMSNEGDRDGVEVTFETAALTLGIVYPGEGQMYVLVTELNYSISDSLPLSDKCWYSVNGGLTNQSVQSAGTNFTGLSGTSGSNTWTVYCNDTAGDESSASVTFAIDDVAPTLSIDYPVDGESYSINVTEINYTYLDDNAGSCWYSVNGGETNSTFVSAGINFTGLSGTAGNNTWTVYCNDTAGNENSSNVTVTLTAEGLPSATDPQEGNGDGNDDPSTGDDPELENPTPDPETSDPDFVDDQMDDVGDCVMNLECSVWEACVVDYSFDDLFASIALLDGEQRRFCEDLGECINPYYELRECSVEVPIYSTQEEICGENYVNVYDIRNDELLSRIRYGLFGEIIPLDIFLSPEEEGYCSYCSDGVLSGDETEIDCGGSCEVCSDFDVETIQHKAILNEKVKWTKLVSANVDSNSAEIDLPSLAERIFLRTEEDADRNLILSLITGNVVEEVFDFLDLGDKKVVNVGSISGGGTVALEYETVAPYSVEEEIDNGKTIKIVGPEEVHYNGVLAYTGVDNLNFKDNAVLYHYNGGIKEEVVFEGEDRDSEEGIDYIEWYVPELSEQNYELNYGSEKPTGDVIIDYGREDCTVENNWCEGSDADKDGDVDIEDVKENYEPIPDPIPSEELEDLREEFGNDNCSINNTWCGCSDLNTDGIVDGKDLSIISRFTDSIVEESGGIRYVTNIEDKNEVLEIFGLRELCGTAAQDKSVSSPSPGSGGPGGPSGGGTPREVVEIEVPITEEDLDERKDVRDQFEEALQEITGDYAEKTSLRFIIYLIFGLVALMIGIIIVVLVRRREIYKDDLKKFKARM
jgi:parallel beta-helix repeat protein